MYSGDNGAPATQVNRTAAISTALGNDVLLLCSFSLQEQIGKMFQMEVELSSADENLNADKILGTTVTVKLQTEEDDIRYFNAVVSRFAQIPNSNGYARYRATLVPWMWFLTRSADCRIFQNKSVPDIIEEVFKPYGGQYKLKLSGSYAPREYCVQYRETDFNFVCRLMEQEGIYFYFEHADRKHSVILADAPSAHKAFPGHEEITFTELQTAAGDAEGIIEWTMEKEVEPGAYSLNDYDFQKPRTSLTASASASRPHAAAKYEMYDYPGEYESAGEGDRLAQTRLDEIQSQHEVLRGRATTLGVATGHKFKLKGHPRQDQNREYLITGMSLHLDAGEFGSGGVAGEFFQCNFQAMPFSQTFRPGRITPKPIVQGPQTAVVTGPKGEEIYVDKYGRVKVQFHWDRVGKKDENSSCYIRVSQYWAGKNWGAIYTPRIGQEVIVEFLEGDPDRPIITGRVYNDAMMPPYPLPDKKTVSTVKSNSSKGGGGSNEVRFEDQKGSEQLFIHAEKNQDNVVKNDETTDVGHDRTETVGHDEKITIGNNRTEKVGVDESITIGANRTEQVGANETIDVTGNRSRTVGGNESVTVAIARTHTVGVNEAITVGAAQEITVGAIQAITVGASQNTNVGLNQSNNVGKDRSTSIGKDDGLKVGKKLTIDAGDEITIKTGKASIHMKKDGTIEIKGKDITIEGSGELKVKASKNITMKGQKILQN